MAGGAVRLDAGADALHAARVASQYPSTDHCRFALAFAGMVAGSVAAGAFLSGLCLAVA